MIERKILFRIALTRALYDQIRPYFLQEYFSILSLLTPPVPPPKKHKNPPLKNPLENPDPWDHAQMIERKILFRIALKRALYDQIRPQFFQKCVSIFDPPSTAPVPPKTTLTNPPPEGVGGLLAGKKENPNWSYLY